MSEEQEHTETFGGYLAMVIELQAERVGKTPQEYVLSFFRRRCNAPSVPVGNSLRTNHNALFYA